MTNRHLEKPLGEPRSLLLVPPRGILEIGLGKRPNDNRRDIRFSDGYRSSCEAFVNSLPAVTSIRVGFEVLQALPDDFPVPVRNRNRLRAGGDSLPERLQIVDLLVDREVVKSRRWKMERGWPYRRRTAAISIALLPTLKR